MASRSVQLTRQVRPLMSVDSSEARCRVLALYKAWWRYIPHMIDQHKLPISPETGRTVLRKRFEANSHVTDIRVIDMLVVKGQQDLAEAVEQWSEYVHIMSKFFYEDEVKKPDDFMSKFLAGKD